MTLQEFKEKAEAEIDTVIDAAFARGEVYMPGFLARHAEKIKVDIKATIGEALDKLAAAADLLA